MKTTPRTAWKMIALGAAALMLLAPASAAPLGQSATQAPAKAADANAKVPTIGGAVNAGCNVSCGGKSCSATGAACTCFCDWQWQPSCACQDNFLLRAIDDAVAN